MSKKEWKMGQIFVAFSEYLNFTEKMTGKYPQELKQALGNMYRIYLLTFLCTQCCIFNLEKKILGEINTGKKTSILSQPQKLEIIRQNQIRPLVILYINLASKYLFTSVLSVAFSTLRKNPWGNKEAGQTQFIAIQKNRKFSN